MKKTVKKLTAFFLVVMIICSTLSFGASAAKEEKAVAKVSVICLVKSPGHVWIYVENLTNRAVKVGAYTLGKRDGVSIGTFGPTRYDGYGIYYNIESYCQTEYGMGNCRYLTEEITASELEALSNGILSYRNSWSPFRNCIAFAAQMWNLISEKKLSNLIFPAFTSIQMFFKGCINDVPSQKSVTADEVYRQKGNGNKAYLKNVREISLRDLA